MDIRCKLARPQRDRGRALTLVISPVELQPHLIYPPATQLPSVLQSDGDESGI